jgi:hypothetical protein
MRGMVPFTAFRVTGDTSSPRSRPGNAHARASRYLPPELGIATDGSSRWWSRSGGVLVVAYLLILFQAFAAVRAMLPRACWVGRLDRRWTDLWMR